MKKVIVKTSENSNNYPIFIGKNILKILPKVLKKHTKGTKKIAIIFDNNVPTKFKKILKKLLKNYDIFLETIKFNEKNKNFNTVEKILKKFLRNNLSRSDTLICVGGGIAGDVSSFVASILKRGINFVNIPTTLLSQNDSSIGGKTGVNTDEGKNIIGTFYQPKFVIIETEFLKSLSRREILCGYAEILKHAIIKDKKFFAWLNKNSKEILQLKNDKLLISAITKSCKVKRHFVLKDTHESNLRMQLNFGHTFAHSLEALHGYSKKLNHGEAVLIGILLATKLSVIKKVCNDKEANKIFEHYKNQKINFNFKNVVPKNKINKIISLMINDKKNNDNKINFILLKKIGKTTSPGDHKLSTSELKKYFPKLINFNF